MNSLIDRLETRLIDAVTVCLFIGFGYLMYEKGRSDVIAEIYKRGWTVAKLEEEDAN